MNNTPEETLAPRSNRETILLVLKTSVELMKQRDFKYPGMENDNHKKFKEWSDKKLEDKIKLFQNVDERSLTYNSILSTAKTALANIQEEEEYNYHSAELIKKFLSIEDMFSKKLKFQGVRETNESYVKKENPKQEETQVNINEENVIHLAEGITGKDVERNQKKIEKHNELLDAFKDIAFEEDRSELELLMN